MSNRYSALESSNLLYVKVYEYQSSYLFLSACVYISGGQSRDVRLIGNPPEVKILGEILPDDTPMMGGRRYPPGMTKGPESHYKPLQPPPRPPVKGLPPLFAEITANVYLYIHKYVDLVVLLCYSLFPVICKPSCIPSLAFVFFHFALFLFL